KLNKTSENTEQSNEEPLSPANSKQQEQNDTKDDQNPQLSVLAELATTNNSLDEQMQATTQEDLLPDTEMLSRDELAIYGYETPHPSASYIFKAASPSDKNEKTDGFITKQATPNSRDPTTL
ncbi:8714_t:CDS:2, partial [Cetraspora pellucida]